jgi:type II secretory pathway pseudopilin PulG
MKNNIKNSKKNFSSLISHLSFPLGFTFIELILVVSMILILGTMGTAFGSRFITQNGVINATDQLVGDFRKAQINAMMGKQNDNWGVNYDNPTKTITLYKGTTFAGRTAAFDEKFSVPAGVGISSSGATDINFARGTGKPSTAPTFTITGSGETRTVTLNAQGMVTK